MRTTINQYQHLHYHRIARYITKLYYPHNTTINNSIEYYPSNITIPTWATSASSGRHSRTTHGPTHTHLGMISSSIYPTPYSYHSHTASYPSYYKTRTYPPLPKYYTISHPLPSPLSSYHSPSPTSPKSNIAHQSSTLWHSTKYYMTYTHWPNSTKISKLPLFKIKAKC